MTAAVLIPLAVTALIAAAGIWLNHAVRRPDPGTRWLGAPPALDPESALLIQQAEADAERESLDRLRGRLPSPAPPLTPLPPMEGGGPWPVSGTGRVMHAGRPALALPVPGPAPPPATAPLAPLPGPPLIWTANRDITEEEAAALKAGLIAAAGRGKKRGTPMVLPARPAPGPDETGERLLRRAETLLAIQPVAPGHVDAATARILGHGGDRRQAVDLAVDSIIMKAVNGDG